LPNPAPADLQLSSQTINESDVIGVPIGTLNTIAADGTLLSSSALTYALVAGEGADDNRRFRVVNGQLQAAEVFDRETRPRLKVRIRVTDGAGLSAEKAFTISVNDLPDPVASAPLPSPALVWGRPLSALDLDSVFDDPLSTGLVATFQLAPVQQADGSLAPLGSGPIQVLLYDQAGQGAPLTTTNLQAYVTANRYNGTFLHRSVPGFVLQGGGFNLEVSPTGNQIAEVTAFPTVRNEYSSGRSNLRGTIAMAKLGTDPNSATSQWFWSLADNSAILNPQNGGFTVFGRVLGASDLASLDALAAVPVYNASSLGSAFGELPLSNGNLNVDNLLRFSAITINQQAELSYAVVSNSDPDLLEARLEGSRLQLRSLANRSEEVALTLRATNLLGESLDQTVRVQLQRRPANRATIRALNDSPGNPTASLARPTLSGTLASSLQADERVRILADGTPIGVATSTQAGLGWSFRPPAALEPGADSTVLLEARVETLEGVAGETSPGWSLRLGSQARLEAPGSALLQLADSRPLVVRPTPVDSWSAGADAWNAGSTTAQGRAVPGTGEMIAITGLNRYEVCLRNAPRSEVTLDLGDGNHAFFLHDALSPQTDALPAQPDWQGTSTAPRFDQLSTIRLGNCSGPGSTSLVDLTSPDFITGPLTVVGGNTPGSRNVIWGSAADDTVTCGAADTVICGSAGRNSFQLGSGADRLQYAAGAGANDRVTGFDLTRDRLELWGVTPGTRPTLSLQATGANTLLSWETNRITFSGQSLALPSPGSLPDWIVVM
jgi:cyclophilin family peptidyl-prolyl cis-trans isomerase